MKNIKGLLYCTKAKPYLADFKGEYQTYSNSKELDELFDKGFNPNDIMNILNGTIPCECDFEVEEICSEKLDVGVGYEPLFYTETIDDIAKVSCLTQFEIENYLGCKEGGEVVGYALHISNLKIFDEPRKLSNYCTKQCQFGKCSTCKYGKNNITCLTIDTPITKAPQNMMYCYDNEGNKYVVISIQPQWLCKILNGEKDIEVRKQVLNCMKGND